MHLHWIPPLLTIGMRAFSSGSLPMHVAVALVVFFLFSLDLSMSSCLHASPKSSVSDGSSNLFEADYLYFTWDLYTSVCTATALPAGYVCSVRRRMAAVLHLFSLITWIQYHDMQSSTCMDSIRNAHNCPVPWTRHLHAVPAHKKAFGSISRVACTLPSFLIALVSKSTWTSSYHLQQLQYRQVSAQ